MHRSGELSTHHFKGCGPSNDVGIGGCQIAAPCPPRISPCFLLQDRLSQIQTDWMLILIKDLSFLRFDRYLVGYFVAAYSQSGASEFLQPLRASRLLTIYTRLVV